MILRTSYYYQIRNFKPYMIPVSTSLGDPKWFHNYQDNYYIFKDKRNIINGIRYNYIMVQKNCYGCPCQEKNYHDCCFLQQYEQELNKLDFNQVINDLIWLSNYFKKQLLVEPIIVLMVHEAWHNPCSERKILQKYFIKHGIECKELEYPIC